VNDFAHSQDQLNGILNEFSGLEAELKQRYQTENLSFRRGYSLEKEGSIFIYAATRLLKPKTILETGVANGQSTFFLLNAAAANGEGEVFSIETSEKVGSLLSTVDKARWHLEVLREPLRKSLKDTLASLPKFDFYLHDSDHRYPWQRFEYEEVFPRMSPGSIFASDDVDKSYAFVDFSKKTHVRPSLLLEKGKAFGYFTLGSR